MKTNYPLIALCFGLLLFMVACKKENSNPLTPKEQLLAQSWNIDSLSMKKISESGGDSSIIKDCVKKSKVIFQTSKQFTIQDVDKSCDSTLLPYDSGVWTLSADGNKLTLKGKREIVWQIQTLSADKVKATFKDSLSPAHNFMKTIVLKK